MVRGRHPVLSPVQLLSWVPSDILTSMVQNYEKLLVAGVVGMLAPPVKPHIGNDGDIQSDAGLSIDGSEETISSMLNSWPSFDFQVPTPTPNDFC